MYCFRVLNYVRWCHYLDMYIFVYFFCFLLYSTFRYYCNFIYVSEYFWSWKFPWLYYSEYLCDRESFYILVSVLWWCVIIAHLLDSVLWYSLFGMFGLFCWTVKYVSAHLFGQLIFSRIIGFLCWILVFHYPFIGFVLLEQIVRWTFVIKGTGLTVCCRFFEWYIRFIFVLFCTCYSTI